MTLDDLIAEREIGRALSLFARAMDARDWDMIAEIMTPDAIGELGEGPIAGRAGFVACFRKYLDGCGPTQHLLGNLVIDVDDDRATSRCYVSDMHLSADPASEARFSTLGDYHDRWQKRSGRWWMVERVKHNRASIGSYEVFGLVD